MPLVRDAAARHKVPVPLILGVIQVESSFKPRARSSAGARGLMQLMPRTARSLARRLKWEDYEITDPAFNIEAGTVYLAYLLKIFDGDLRYALAGYNAGPSRVLRWVKAGRPLANYSERYAAAVLAARDAFIADPSGRDHRAKRATPERENAQLDRDGLRNLVNRQQLLYGERPDEVLPASRPAR